MPGDFQFAATPDVWVPLRPPTGGLADLAIVGRLRAGTTHLAARQDMDRVMGVVRVRARHKNSRPDELLVPLRQQLVGDVEPMLVSLLAGVVLVLVIACVNTAQLLLAQLHARRRELAIRAALGASTRRLAGEVLADVLLLVTGGGAAGLAAGVVGVKLLRTYGADRLPRASELTFDAQSAFAALGVIALAAIMVSIVPMRLGSRVQLMDTLRSGGRGAGLRGISIKARRALVVGELAGSLVLVTSAGLLVRSLSHQLNANLGFDAVHGVTFEVSLPPISYPERPFAHGDGACGGRSVPECRARQHSRAPGRDRRRHREAASAERRATGDRFHARRRAAGIAAGCALTDRAVQRREPGHDSCAGNADHRRS